MKPLAILLFFTLSAGAADYGLKFSADRIPIRTNTFTRTDWVKTPIGHQPAQVETKTIIYAQVAQPTADFWRAWRTNKAGLKAHGYTCRPSTNGWQILRVEK